MSFTGIALIVLAASWLPIILALRRLGRESVAHARRADAHEERLRSIGATLEFITSQELLRVRAQTAPASRSASETLDPDAAARRP
jgi:hypothetical protein